MARKQKSRRPRKRTAARTNRTAKKTPSAATKFESFNKAWRRILSGKFRTRNSDWKGRFLEAFGVTGNMSAAAMLAGVGRTTVYEHMQKDADFKAKVDDAGHQASELRELDLDERAFAGVEIPVFFEGRKIGSKLEKDSTLAMFRMKALKPQHYRERVSVKNETPNRPIDPAAAIGAIAAFMGAVQQASPDGGAGAEETTGSAAGPSAGAADPRDVGSSQ